MKKSIKPIQQRRHVRDMSKLNDTRKTYKALKSLYVMAEETGDNLRKLELYEEVIPIVLKAGEGSKGKSLRNMVLGFCDMAQRISDNEKRLEYYEALLGYIYDGISFLEYENDIQLMLNLFTVFYEYDDCLQRIWREEETEKKNE